MPLKLGVPRETASGERRVSIDPVVLSQLTKLGIKVFVEKGAGESAFLDDAVFGKATIVEDFTELTEIADIIWKVQAPTLEEINTMRRGSVLIGTLMTHNNIDMLKALENKKITSFSLDLIPQLARAQSMNVVSSQASIVGYKAAIMAADYAPKFFPLLTTAAGTISPAKVIVIGADVAGLQAMATAKRLGAVVEAYDVRPESKAQILSLGVTPIELELAPNINGELTSTEREQQQQELAEYIAEADVLITSVEISGKAAPKIIPNSTVEMMRPGSIIIDLAIESGGNCNLSKRGKTTNYAGVVIHAPLNVASQMPLHASQIYAKNLFNFLALLIDDKGEYAPNFEDEIVLSALLTKDGEVMHEETLELLNNALEEEA